MKIVVLSDKKVKELNDTKAVLTGYETWYNNRLESLQNLLYDEEKLSKAYERSGNQEKADEHRKKFFSYDSECTDLEDKITIIKCLIKTVEALV